MPHVLVSLGRRSSKASAHSEGSVRRYLGKCTEMVSKCHRTTERIQQFWTPAPCAIAPLKIVLWLKCIFSARTESSLGLVCAECPHDCDSGGELERELDLDYSRWATTPTRPTNLLLESKQFDKCQRVIAKWFEANCSSLGRAFH